MRFLTAASALLIALPGAVADAATGYGSTAESQVPFVDRTDETGLRFTYFNGMSGELYLPEITGGGAALLDYDNDGDLDVFLTQGQMLGPGKKIDDALFPPADPAHPGGRLFRNDLDSEKNESAGGASALRFTDVTVESGVAARGYGIGVTSADFDNDGWADLLLANFGPNQLWRNRGDGTFEDVSGKWGVAAPGFSVGATAFDYDRDGRLDIYIVNYVDFRFFRHRKCTSETATLDYCGPLNFAGQPDRLYRNLGDRFVEVTDSAGILAPDSRGLGAVTGDFNGDGWIDLYVANDQMPNHLWINQRNDTMRDEALLAGAALNRRGEVEASMGVDAADFDGDGLEDLFMTHLGGETNTLYLNRSGAVFDDVTATVGLARSSFGFTGFGAAWIDYDNDGWLDLAMVNGAIKSIEALARQGDPYPLHQSNLLYRSVPKSSGQGRNFELISPLGEAFERSEVSRGLARGDLDNDGDHDLIVVNNSGPTRVLINQVGHHSSWLGVELEGATSKQALGARVGLMRAGPGRDRRPTLWRRVRTDGSYASAHDPRILFGLGPGGTKDRSFEIRVEWPGGDVEIFRARSGEYSRLIQGQGTEWQQQ